MDYKRETLRDNTSVYDRLSEGAVKTYLEAKGEGVEAVMEAHSFVLFAVIPMPGGKGAGIQVISSIIGMDPKPVIEQLRDTADKLERVYAENVARRSKEVDDEKNDKKA